MIDIETLPFDYYSNPLTHFPHVHHVQHFPNALDSQPCFFTYKILQMYHILPSTRRHAYHMVFFYVPCSHVPLAVRRPLSGGASVSIDGAYFITREIIELAAMALAVAVVKP